MIKYRPDIDGLRALAVLPVILFHAGVPGWSGGFLGVDVFFVISGYLITKNLASKEFLDKAALLDFYNRRARRILPALSLMLCMASVLAFILMTPSQLGDFGQSLIASVTFSANIYFWLKTNYWAPSAELTPLLHIWSLGIEEQFYLLFPWVFILVKSKKYKVWILMCAGFLSLVAMLYVDRLGFKSESFYLLPFRAWELIAGSLTAMLAISKSEIFTPKINNAIKIISLLSLIGSLSFFNNQSDVLFLYSIPILASCILMFNSHGMVSSLLSKNAFVYIGSISYGLYLFHQPALAFIRIYSYDNPTQIQILAALISTLFLAAISNVFIEQPIRQGKGSPKAFYAWLFVITAILMAFGVYLTGTNGLKAYKLSKMNLETSALFKALESEQKSRHQLWAEKLEDSSSPFKETSGRKILFLGDSISEDLYISAEASLKQTDIVQYRRLKLDDTCFKFLDSYSNNNMPDGSCREQISTVMGSDLLKNSTDVVIANLWEGSNVGTISAIFGIPQFTQKNIILYGAPTFTDISSILYYLAVSGLENQDLQFKNFIYKNRNERRLSINQTIEKISRTHNAAYINAFDFYCSDTKNTCELFDGNTARIIDGLHLSISGLSHFSPWLKITLDEAINNSAQLN
ncbi:acyltransferase [Polynucleobacter sp. AP-Kaivos-20-H2]|uniref:acyltransferase family protein n=1 Tax=Polynucleobacter sp. AP-Kaivos-20-H2 TaxID=2689104 RepID=UPI002104A9B6|nr:acyltransferase [Polynucleobacter sp. AP-Kaivos-20-H2]MBU3604099.1 acyltransferase [Polynucleobacter sp. AP-Kaivos-20-H2]